MFIQRFRIRMTHVIEKIQIFRITFYQCFQNLNLIRINEHFDDISIFFVDHRQHCWIDFETIATIFIMNNVKTTLITLSKIQRIALILFCIIEIRNINRCEFWFEFYIFFDFRIDFKFILLTLYSFSLKFDLRRRNICLWFDWKNKQSNWNVVFTLFHHDKKKHNLQFFYFCCRCLFQLMSIRW